MFETMTGTTGSTFSVVSKSKSGKIGVRNIGGDSFRVRVEPAAGVKLAFPSGWTTPGGGQNRYSNTAVDAISTAALIATAQKALDAASLVGVTVVQEKVITTVVKEEVPASDLL